MKQTNNQNETRSIQNRMFQKWIYKHGLANETPLIISESFRILEDPLQAIKDYQIKCLQQKTKDITENMHYGTQFVSKISKSNYQKVLSRDKIEYHFGSSYLLGDQYTPKHYQQMNKRSTKKKDDNTRLLMKRQQLQKTFVHSLNQIENNQKSKERQLTIDIIKDLDSKDFDQKYNDVQFYDIFRKASGQIEKYTTAYGDISQNYEMDELFNKITFNLIDKDTYYGVKSSQYLFVADQELDFWRRYANDQQQTGIIEQIQIMKRCQNFNLKQPTFLNMLDFSSGKIDGPILSSYIKLKQRHQTQMKLNENDENLEQQYKKKKQQYDFLREMKTKDKTQRISVKQIRNTAQTIDNLEDRSFDSYFEQSAKDIIIKVTQLNKMRDVIMQRKQNQETKKVMLVNIGHEIKNLLFRLLSLTLKGEKFVNYDELVKVQDKNSAQKKILQKIYHEFHKIEVLQVDAIPKTQILNIYLQQRQKNQKMFELLGRMYDKEGKDKKAGKKKIINKK